MTTRRKEKNGDKEKNNDIETRLLLDSRALFFLFFFLFFTNKHTNSNSTNQRWEDENEEMRKMKKKSGRKISFPSFGLVYSYKINCQQGHKVVSTILLNSSYFLYFFAMSLEGFFLIFRNGLQLIEVFVCCLYLLICMHICQLSLDYFFSLSHDCLVDLRLSECRAHFVDIE
jgi:hypothetical protein